MATLKQERELREVARFISRKLRRVYGEEMGVFLTVTPFKQSEPVSDYISNIERKDGIAALRDTADRLETKETIPASVGRVQ
jgi:hypothetical protein